MEKEEKIIIIISVIVLIYLNFIAFIVVDFINDYKCSINRYPEYWKEHNCIKYCKECEKN